MEKLFLARVSKPEFVELDVRGSTARQPESVRTFLDRRPQGQRGTDLPDTRNVLCARAYMSMAPLNGSKSWAR